MIWYTNIECKSVVRIMPFLRVWAALVPQFGFEPVKWQRNIKEGTLIHDLEKFREIRVFSIGAVHHYISHDGSK